MDHLHHPSPAAAVNTRARPNRLIATALALAPWTIAAAAGQAATSLPAIEVNASRLDIAPFDVPAALSVVQVDPGKAGLPGVNFSEAIVGVPGILARDRKSVV